MSRVGKIVKKISALVGPLLIIACILLPIIVINMFASH